MSMSPTADTNVGSGAGLRKGVMKDFGSDE